MLVSQTFVGGWYGLLTDVSLYYIVISFSYYTDSVVASNYYLTVTYIFASFHVPHVQYFCSQLPIYLGIFVGMNSTEKS